MTTNFPGQARDDRYLETLCLQCVAAHEEDHCQMNNDIAVPSASLTSISRGELIDLPIRRYDGPVVIVGGQADLQRAMRDILDDVVIGFDTETRPAFKPGESYLPSIVQFATARAVYLLRAQQEDLMASMQEILSSPNVVKAGVSVTDDLRALKKLFEFDESSVIDLGSVARRHGLKQTGVRNLAGMFLGMRISKGAQTSNWSAARLTPQQVTYAATDAWVCRELYLRFSELKML